MAKPVAEAVNEKRERPVGTPPSLPVSLVSVIDAVLTTLSPHHQHGAEPPPATRRTPSEYAASATAQTDP